MTNRQKDLAGYSIFAVIGAIVLTALIVVLCAREQALRGGL